MDIKAVLGDAYKEGMTVEELTTALAKVELPKDQSEEINHLKEVISNKNSEAAEWRKKFEATLDESQKKELAAQEQAKKDAEELAQLKKEKAIASYKASYLSMGYEESLAEDTANALFEGNDAKLFENQKKHMEAVEKKAREDALRGSGRPGGSGSGSSGEESDAVKLAKSLGKERAEIDAKVNEGMKQFY